MYSFILVFIGGGLGSLARYGIGIISNKLFNAAFPTGTLISNTVSCIVLGLLLGWFFNKGTANENTRLFVAVGFCGGFSTFSTFTAETFDLLRHGQYLISGINILLNLVLCLLCFIAGWALSKNF